MVGEVFLFSPAAVATYYGDDDELHLAFNFKPLFAPWWHRSWARLHHRDGRRHGRHGAPGRPGASPTTTTPVTRTRYDRAAARRGETDEVRPGAASSRARAAAVLLLTLRGTPFFYQGEELGLEDAVIPAERVVDPGGRDGSRAPMPWAAAPDLGWPTAPGVEPWLPFPPDAELRNYAVMRDDPGSILHLYRRDSRSAPRRTGPHRRGLRPVRRADWCWSPSGVRSATSNGSSS